MRESMIPVALEKTDDKSARISRIVHYAAHLAPSRMPTQPWWDELPPEFATLHESFKLRPWDRLRVESTAAIDVAVRTFAAGIVGSTAVPMGFNPAMLRKSMEEAPFYRDLADRRDPDEVFVRPPRRVHVRTRPARGAFFDPAGGVCEDVTFESPFVPLHPGRRAEWSKSGDVNVAHARLFRHEGAPRPTIIAVHGFMADFYALNEWFFAIRWFYEMGCNVAVFTLPHHGHRQARLSPFSGYGFFAGGLTRVNESFAQAICDLRVLLDWLEARHEVDRVGITGVSVGGYTTALAAGVEPRFAFAIPNVPVVSIPDIVQEWEPIGTAMRAAMKLTGMTIQDARHIVAPVTPLTYAPRLPQNRLMIIGGAGDRLAPPKHSRLLWDHWGRPRMHWFPGSHLLHLDKGTYLKHMASFLSDIGFVERRPKALPGARRPRR